MVQAVQRVQIAVCFFWQFGKNNWTVAGQSCAYQVRVDASRSCFNYIDIKLILIKSCISKIQYTTTAVRYKNGKVKRDVYQPKILQLPKK